MSQRNFSSYLPVIYILCVVLSIFIIHLSEVISAHYHTVEMKNIDKVKKKSKPIKSNKKSTTKSKKTRPQKKDTTNKVSKPPITQTDSVKTKVTYDDADFFAELTEKYNAQRDHSMSRTDVVIRYYKKNKDGDRVYQLRNLGFYIHERPAEDDFDDYTSNAIFYGDSVKRQDLIMIAYNLMESGVKLQSITLSKFHDAWKAHSVEIGTDTTVLDKKPFTLVTLREKWTEM